MTKIFVFGSNLQGVHGKGAALFARKYRGAIYRVGKGPQGQSYAIPTKANPGVTLTLDEIELEVLNFLAYARSHPELIFEVTKIGCGLAGYTEAEIAPMFQGAPVNCELPKGWRK